MAKKPDSFYYDNFAHCAKLACDAARMLDGIIRDFDPDGIEKAVHDMHVIEQEADEHNHMVSDALLTAFITPIEREDISLLSDTLDVVIDRIEGVLHRIYFCNIRSMRPEAMEMSGKIVTACDQMYELVKEFPEFKRSRSLREHIIAINTIEEEADHIFIKSMRDLHVNERDALQVIAWRDVYTFLEYCADSCEHVAGVIDTIVMKNS